MKIVPLEMFGYDAPAQVRQHHPRLEVVWPMSGLPQSIGSGKTGLRSGRFMFSPGKVVAANQQYYATRPR
jgi:hypothetical protein